jgi:hypothetical protein
MRQANLEVFRLRCMFFIVWFHLSAFGPVSRSLGTTYWARILFDVFNVLFEPAVNGMVGLSGLFMTRVNIRRLVCLWLMLWFYNYLWYQVMPCMGLGRWAKWRHIYTPLLNGNYWFVTSYIFMSLLVPSVNLIAQSLTKFEYFMAILVIYSLSALRKVGIDAFLLVEEKGLVVWHLVKIFFICAYFRVHGNPFNIIVQMVCYSMGFIGHISRRRTNVDDILSRCILRLTGLNSREFLSLILLYGHNKFSSILMGVFGLLLYRNLDIPGDSGVGRLVCFLSSRSMAIYLIHIGPQLGIHPVMWMLRIFWTDQKPLILNITYIRFTITEMMNSVGIDVYRGFLFSCCEYLMEKVKNAIQKIAILIRIWKQE